jgi:hypothetical protein
MKSIDKRITYCYQLREDRKQLLKPNKQEIEVDKQIMEDACQLLVLNLLFLNSQFLSISYQLKCDCCFRPLNIDEIRPPNPIIPWNFTPRIA